MWLLEQVASAGTIPQTAVWDVLVKGFEIVLGVAGTYAVNVVRGMRKDVSSVMKTMDRWDVEFFGINGDNGMRGNVKTLMAEREERMRGRRGASHHRAEDGE